MKFLKQPDDKGEAKDIQVNRVVEITIQCECGYWGKQKGGPTGDGKAVFQCPECKGLNWMKWSLD